MLDGDDIILTQCDYFTVRRLKVQNRVQLRIDKTSFHSLIITDGSGELYMGGEILKLNKEIVYLSPLKIMNILLADLVKLYYHFYKILNKLKEWSDL